MIQAQVRKQAYFTMFAALGRPVGKYYNRFLREDREGIAPDTTKNLLAQLLTHCAKSVPYYAEVMRDHGTSFRTNPTEYLERMPVLTKHELRTRLEDLKSSDLARRKWYSNTSGGSTGEPAYFIQDAEYDARAGAIKQVYSRLIGKDVGESEVLLWGSLRDVSAGRDRWQARFVNSLLDCTFVNAYRLMPDAMQRTVELLNAKRPRLIVAYVEAIYELARYAQREGLEVVPQSAIMVTANTLDPLQRAVIESVFQCKVYNRYGSREVGDVACERPGYNGLWVAPWGNYLEIVNGDGKPVPPGTEGEILVTSLTNYAMPLVRYRIGDRGILAPPESNPRFKHMQVLQEVVGRIEDTFVTRTGAMVHGCFFASILYHKPWILRYQVIQKSYSRIIFRFVRAEGNPQEGELDKLAQDVKQAMGDDCDVQFEFVDDIATSESGKFRYIKCEIPADATREMVGTL